MGIFDGLPDPSAPGQAFMAGMQRGRAEREDRETRGALSAYAMNPDDPVAFEQLARYRPDFAIQIREDQTKRQRAAQVAELTQRAAAGDTQAIQELAPIDIDAFLRLDKRQQEHIARGVDYVGQAALAISQLPEEQRAAAWDSYAQQGVEQGFTELQDEIGGYSPEALQSAIAEAKLTQEAIRLAQPRYQAIPEGGTLVDTSNPAAVQAFTAGQGAAPVRVSTPAEAAALPPGTRFIDPNGVERMVPGGAGGNASGNFLR